MSKMKLLEALDATVSDRRRWVAETVEIAECLSTVELPSSLDEEVEWDSPHSFYRRTIRGRIEVPGPWAAVRARAQEVARALGARTWRRRPDGRGAVCYDICGALGALAVKIEVAALVAGVMPESCRHEDRAIPAQPARTERVLVCGMPDEEPADGSAEEVPAAASAAVSVAEEVARA